MAVPISRSDAACAVVEALEPAFFNACCHPVRLDLIRRLVEVDKADVGEIAVHFVQDRSVISRHLAQLERAGIVASEKSGRHVFYTLNGPNIVARFEVLLTAIKALSQICCPTNEGSQNGKGISHQSPTSC